MKVEKAEAEYDRGSREEHCGRLDAMDSGFCLHFIDRRQAFGECTEVNGRIGRTMWCKFWQPAQ